MKIYTVKRGDTLYNIAQQEYGDGELYLPLAAYNGLENPNALEIGQVVRLPDASLLKNPLQVWHNYQTGAIYWRVLEKGVEVKGKGVVTESTYTEQVATIWKMYQDPILAASTTYGVPVPVILATISTESSGNPESYRYEPGFYRLYIKQKPSWRQNPYYDFPERIAASYGLMQIMYTTAWSVGFRGAPEDLYDPAVNIAVGAAYIASPYQQRQHGWDPPKIACAYNAGSVRSTMQNPWGMYHHPGHLDRWIPSYNGAIEHVSAVNMPEHPAPVVELEPSTPESPEEFVSPQIGVKLLLPALRDEWTPMIIDLFLHKDSGLAEPVSYPIDSPSSDTSGGYTYSISKLPAGIYDIVLVDAASGSVINDLADVMIESPPVSIDLRSEPQRPPAMEAQEATLRIRFVNRQGQPWTPVIVDLFLHAPGGIGSPVSSRIAAPQHEPDGTYFAELEGVQFGVYDVVFTDATTQSVMTDVSDYVVDQSLMTLDLDIGPTTRGGQGRGLPSQTVFEAVKSWWKRLWSGV